MNSTTLTIRMSAELREALQHFADRRSSNPSRIICDMTDSLVRADQKHGDHLVWPPRFDYFEDETVHEKKHKLQVNGISGETDSVLREVASTRGTSPEQIIKEILLHYLLEGGGQPDRKQ